MTAKVAAESVIADATYRYTKNPVVIGQLRHKVWRYLIEPIDDQDPIWVARCGNYWTIQQETFGLKFSPFTFTIDRDEKCVITWAVLLDVLPGKREVDYVCPRVREGRQAKQPALTEAP